jgi:hypothetical protein
VKRPVYLPLIDFEKDQSRQLLLYLPVLSVLEEGQRMGALSPQEVVVMFIEDDLLRISQAGASQVPGQLIIPSRRKELALSGEGRFYTQA